MHQKNKMSLSGTILFLCRLLFIAGLTSCAFHAVANRGDEYIVVLSQGCPWIMAEGPDNQFLAHVTQGSAPSLGDRLAGTLKRSGTVEMKNLTRNTDFQMEIEILESPSSTRGVMRYGQLCGN